MLRTLPLLALLLFFSVPSHAEKITPEQHTFEHIHFKRITPNSVTFNQDAIRFDVNRSASFLLLAFEDIKPVHRVSFEWKADGMLNKDSVEQEKTRKGDDAWIRVGLLISGQPEPVPEALLPRWMRQVRQTLQHPSDRMLYLIPGAWHAPGTTWKSPYSPDIDMISVASTDTDNNWQRVVHEFSEPRLTAGLWIMADGDNTDSIFSSQLKNLVIE
jgi:hypothetical protein